MISSGMRIGAWDYPKWKHVTPLIDDDGEVIAAKLIVYAGEPEQYYSFYYSERISIVKGMDRISPFLRRGD